MTNLFTYIKAAPFFKDYLPHIRSWKHKMRGKNGRGNSLDFSDEEKKEIIEAARKVVGCKCPNDLK